MSFELNNYHRNISAEDLLTDVQNVAKKLNKNTLTGTEYNQYGTYNQSTPVSYTHLTLATIRLV